MNNTIFTIPVRAACKSSTRKPFSLLSFILTFLSFFLFSVESYAQCITDNTINLKRPVCGNSRALLEGSHPSSSNGAISYIWEINREGNCGENKFEIIPEATGQDYSVPLNDPGDACYRRVAISGNCRDESNKINFNGQVGQIALPRVDLTQPTCSIPTGSFHIIEPETAISFNVNGRDYPVENDVFSNLSPGNYAITVKYVGGCTSPVVNVVINQPPTEPTGSITPTSAAICPNGGSQVLTATGGTSYQWQLNGNNISSATSNTYRATSIGEYSVIIIKDGCSAPASNKVTITSAPVPELKITNPPASCTVVDITAPAVTAGNSTGLTYSYWTNEAATNPVANPKAVLAGTYYIKATNSNGCSTVAPVVVTITPPPTGTISPASPSFCAGSSVTLNAPSNFASYQWYKDGSAITSATSGSFIASSSGSYSVDFVTASGCKGTASTNVIVTNPPSAPITPASGAICTGGSTTLSISGGNSYQWYKDGTAIPNATQNTYTVTATGSYTADIISGDCKGKSSNAVTITQAASPTGTISSSGTVLCPSANATLTVTGGSSYQWYRNGNKIENATASVYTATQAGTYTADIINGSCIRKATNQIVITAGTVPAGSIAPATASFCQGQSAVLTASGGTAYQWYRNGVAINGATSATLTVREAGSYTADVFNSNGCKGEIANGSVVTVNPIPTGSITPEKLTICRGGSGLLTATGADTYQWYKDGVAIRGATSANYTATDPGAYTVDLINGDCIGKASNTVAVTVGAELSGTITPARAELCEGGAVVLTATGGSSFQWYKDGQIINGATGNTYTATEEGTYTANIFSGTCRGRILNEAVITKGSAPTGSITPAVASFCNGGSVRLSVSGGDSYQWYKDGVAIAGATAATYNATTSGTYTADIMSGGCKGKATNNVTVTQMTPPAGAITPATGSICTGERIALTASGGTNYQWYRNGVLIQGATGANYTASETGIYTADVINQEGCIGKSSNEATITSKPAPTGTISPAIVNICNGASAVVTVTGGASYQWYKDGVVIPGATQSTLTITAAGRYSADIINGACTGKASNEVVAVSTPPPSGAITPATTQICNGGTTTLTVTGGTTYQWYKDGSPITDATGSTLSVTQAGTYTADIINAGGCKGKATNESKITIKATPTGTISPSTLTICNGGSGQLTATGGTSYQWFKDGVEIPGARSATYSVSQAGVYTVDIFDEGCKGKASNEVVVSIGAILNGTITPATAVLCNNGTVVLTATGGASYQWYKDGQLISGATSSTYTATTPGTYSADLISGLCNGKASNEAVITAGTTPTGAITPATASLCANGSVLLTAAGGTTYQWYRDGTIINGATSATYSATQAGSYTADIINGDCKGKTSNTALVSAVVLPTQTISPASASLCTGASVVLTVNGGASYQWYRNGSLISGATAASYTAIEVGVYTADIITPEGCKVKAGNEVNVIAAIGPVGTIHPATVGICTGSTATLTTTGGTAYQWYRNSNKINGATGAILNVNEAGTYSVDIINGSCVGKATNEAVVTIGSSPTGAITPASGTICSGGSLLLTATGGTNYQWYKDGVLITGATAATFTVTTAGAYSVDIINGDCKGKASNEAVVTVGVNLTGSISPATGTICTGGSLVLTATGGATYQWFKDGVAINGATINTYTATSPGLYTVDLINGDCKGKASNGATITAGTAPIGAIIPANATLCTNGSAVLTASGGTAYQWYKDGTPISGATTATYTVTRAGNYTVDIINGDCKGKASNEVVVTAGTAPSGTITPATATLCNNASVVLTASGGTSYQWYRNGVAIAGATSATYTVTQSGSYTVDIINGDCKGKADNTAVITEGASLTGTISPASGAICTGQTIVLTATGGSSYQWYKDGAAIAGAIANTYTATTTGTYTVDLINGDCKGKASNQAVITAGTVPTGSISPATASLCTNGSIELTATGGDTYQWYKDAIAITAATGANYLVTAPGVYSVMIIKGGCSGPATNTVNVATSSTINFNSTVTAPSCAIPTGIITFTNVAGGTGNTYTYSIDNAASFQSDATFAKVEPGIYQLVVKDAAGCRSAAQAVTVKQAETSLSATASTTDAACGQTNGAVTITATGGTPDYLYSLDKGSFQSSNVFSNLSVGKHEVIIKDKPGCTFTVVFDIKESGQAPNLVITNPAAICPAGTTDLKVASVTAGSDAGLTFTYWTNAAATAAVADPEKVGAGTYYIKATTSTGCFSIKPVVVSSTSVTPGSITPAEPAVTCSGTPVTLTASSGTAYQWFKDDVLIPSATSASYIASEGGRYSVMITSGTCAVKASNTVVVQIQNCIPAAETKVFVPTAFTPNKNGANDLLQPYFLNVQQLVQFKVFNRWGQLVYQTNIIGKGWDGKLKGVDQPTDTYTWLLECVDFTGKTIKQSGRSLLIR